MNKMELIAMLEKECRISRKEAATVVELFFESMSEGLAGGDRVEIRGLCSFCVKEYESYKGRNPKTGESVQVAPKKLPFFKCGKELKKRVDYWPVNLKIGLNKGLYNYTSKVACGGTIGGTEDTDKPKVLITMDNDLLDRVDDFRFENRINSGSEANRRLINEA